VKYLSAADILQIHSMVVDETGGFHGVHNYDAILSLEETPKQKVFGKELYPDIFFKAAVYTYNIIMSHLFLDGNKRTGMTAASVFLEDNHYKVIAKRGQVEKFALKIISDRLNIEKIAEWFKNHTKKIKK